MMLPKFKKATTLSTAPLFTLILFLKKFGCIDKGQYFQDRTERAGKPGKEDPPEAETQRRVSSRGDIDKWSKLAETSKHWQVCWWPPRIRSRDSASFYLVTAMPCIILQVSGVVSDMLYTTWGFPIWKHFIWGHGHGSPIYLSLTQTDRVTGSVLRPSLKLFSGINFQIVHNCDKNAD